jgi:hypothetical protein
LKSAADPTAVANPPPLDRTVSRANCAEPEKITMLATTGAAAGQPAATAFAPKVTPSSPVETASGTAARAPAGKPDAFLLPVTALIAVAACFP